MQRSCRELCAFEDCKEAVFSPDGASLATLHCDKTIKLWNLPVRKPLARILAVAAQIYLLGVSLFWLFTTMLRKLTRGRPFSKHRVLAAQPLGALREIGHEVVV
jgi:hypothetical protein